MIRGVNKKIIEVKNTNNDYFERAILFVKEPKKDVPQKLLEKKADSYIVSLSSFSKEKSAAQNSYSTKTEDIVIGCLKLITAACVGALITAILLLCI